jgi:hypothetical protein
MTGSGIEVCEEPTSPPLLFGASQRVRRLLTKEGETRTLNPYVLLMPRSEEPLIVSNLLFRSLTPFFLYKYSQATFFP